VHEPPADNFHRRERILWLGTQAFGPVVHESDRLLRGTHEGRTVWVESDDEDRQVDRILRLAVAMPDVPVRFQLRKKYAGTIHLRKPILCKTGDERFDATMELTCLPMELGSAFDEPVRGWLMTAFEPVGPIMGAASGRLALRLTLPVGGHFRGQRVEAATPELLRGYASGLLHFADRLVAEHTRIHDEIARTRGPEAAAAWLAEQRAAAADLDAGRARRHGMSCLVVGIITAVFLGVPCLLFAILFALSELSGP